MNPDLINYVHVEKFPSTIFFPSATLSATKEFCVFICRRNAWAQREAFLLLERREKEGLPLIDGNLIDPANIDLPEDGELGDFEIIV